MLFILKEEKWSAQGHLFDIVAEQLEHRALTLI